ncbi:microtubule-actin cross-linking factor 1 isoform X15 [Oreochromis aureus]|uniref:microtubule-actin cross-linking factor 1 isoform X15 n=1 Tax=Oreochromis aureus TaxID=47969 RepID=UPI00195427B7|nr:microtubule-actin cross-linking factor 1 isoform X15 [Oreochromis aureus]
MGNSMGCVRPPREGELGGAPPLSPKKRLRFRRKHKGKKSRKGEAELEDSERQRSLEPDEKEEEEDEDEEEKAAVRETFGSDFNSRARTQITVPDTHYSKTNPHSNTLSPGSVSTSAGGLLGSIILEGTPKPSPAWKGVFCFPGEEDTVSAIIDVSSIPSQTTSTTPVNTAPALGSTTPGGGRVYRVREKVQGVLEKPWILRQKKEKKDKGREDKNEREHGGEKGGGEGAVEMVKTPSDRQRKGVVHIKEVDGKLCVVRTVYPSDYGSPVWRGESDGEVEVHKEPPTPSPVTENILKVQLSEQDQSRTKISAGDFPTSSSYLQIQETSAVKGFRLDSPACAQERASLLESGYASDLPLTSPETAGTTPSQTDWGGLTSSSSERLDSMIESPLSVQHQATRKCLPQISEIYVCGESADLTAKEKLLLWSQQAIEGYPGLRCVNFTSSWSDGRMFNALLHRYRPDLIDMEVVSRQSNRENLEQAFEIAESLGVTRLLDAEDVDVPSPDEKSVITYVSSIYDAFPKIPEGGEGIGAHEVDQRWSEYQSRFSSLLQWSRQHTALMANKNFPQNPVELKALYNEYVHFKETEIPAKEIEKGHIEHLYKLLEVWIEFGRIKLPQGLHPNDLEEDWGKLILEMLEREKVLRPAVERLDLLLQRANKIQNMSLDCEEKLTLAKNTLQADLSRAESGEGVQCERELACYLQDCESLIQQLYQELKILREEKYYQVEQLVFRVSRLQEELVSLRLQCSSVYRKGHFSQALGTTGTEHTSQRPADTGLSLGQTLLGAVGAVGAALLRRPMARSQLVAMSSSEDEGSLRFIYELLGWVEETQELLERAEWGADLTSVEKNLDEHNNIHTAIEELMNSLQEARSYEAKVSPNFKSSYSETLAKLENQYCKLLEHSSWRLRSLESLHMFVSQCTDELIWLNEREEEEIAYDWSDNNTNMNAKKELYSEMRLELDEKRDVMRSLQETASRLCQENHPAKQTVEAYSAALQTQWQWVDQLCLCVEQHLKDNTAYFQFMSDTRDCESYLRQLQETIKRQYTCDKNSRLSKLEDLLQDSMEEKEQLIEYRSTVASLVGRAKTVVQLRPRSAESTLGTTTPIKAVCDYKQIETNVQITISRGEECVLQDNSQRTKWKVISPTGNEAMVPSVCFTVPPPNQEAIDTASRAEQLYQKVMSLWHQLHVNMKSVVSWHYLLKDIKTVSGWNLDTVRSQSPSDREHVLDHLESQLADFLSDSKESSLFTPAERRELEKDVQQAQQHCQDLLLNMETVEKDESVSRSYQSELQNITLCINEAEQRLMRSIETPPPILLSGDGADNTVQIREQEKLQSELDNLRSSLGDVSHRCVKFFEEKPTSSSVPVLRSELNHAVEKIDKLHNLSAVYLEKLKTVDVLIRSLDEAESQVRKYESRLSEEDIVPADTAAIQNLRDQLGKWQAELGEQEGVFQSLQVEVRQAKEAGSKLNRLHPDRSPELERYQDKANQITERWSGIKRQMETRRADLEALGSSLQQYRDGHSALVKWIEETTERQENTQPGQMDSKALSEQLAQQTALVAEIEQNQTKLDECQTHSKQYCASVKDYELQLMTFRAFVESMHKSPVKRRRLHSSSDAITQEFMDLRTRYTALVTLTTQHVKYISDALRRLEEEEKEVEEEKQARVGQVSDLLGWVKGLQGRAGGPNAESSLAAQQAINEQLAAKKDQVAEAIRSTQVFLLSKQASKLSPEERAHVEAQLDELKTTYNQLCDSSTQQLQQLEQQLAKEEERKVVQQQKAECTQKLEGLSMWLAGAASLLASQRPGAESGDVDILQEKQRKLKEVQKDLHTKGEGIAEAIRSVEELLSERGETLSPEERENLQAALTRMKEQYSALTDSANATLSELDTAINNTVQQNTQRAKAVEELQETRTHIDSLLNELSTLNQPGKTLAGSSAAQDVIDSPFSPPEGAVMSHTEMLQAELQQLQAQQAQLLQITQSTRSLLEQPDTTVPPEEKQRLRAALDQLQAQHQDKLQSCQDRLRKSEALKDELTKFLQEHGSLGTWLEQSEKDLRSLGEGETDAQGLKGRLDEHRKLAEDVICHKADLRFVSISGQKVLDSVQGALEQVGGSDASLESTKQLVTDKLQDANHRYTSLHTKSTELGSRLSGLLERYQQYQDEVVSLHSWLSTQEQSQSIAKASGETDPQNLQNTLRQVQLLQDELAERSVQLEKVKRAGRDLVSTDESPSLKAVDILCAADGLEKRFDSLSTSVSERAEQLQTAVAQSVSVQEGLKGLLSWLDKLALSPGPIEPTAQAVQDALTQNQKLRQELLSRQGSVDATRDSVSKLLHTSDASTASGLQGSLEDLTQRFTAAQASQAEREAELKGLLPKLESYERLWSDLQVFTQSRVKALSPVGQPDRSVDDYRQTIEEVRSELEQEAGQLKSFCNLGTELSQSKAFSNTQSLLDNVKGVTDEFNQLEENVNERFAAIQACEQQLLQFRGLSGSLVRWLQTAQDQLPSKEANLNTEGLQRRVQQLKDLLNDWESQGSRVQELNKTGSELESLIIDITAPQTKTGAPHINGSAGPSSVNGIHTCKDLTELQVAVSDVNSRYDALGGELKERLGQQQASLELRQKARQGTEELKSWLTDREQSLKQAQTASPSKPEVVRAQAQENKALLSELAEHSGKVEELKSTLRKLIAENPDSPEADTWRQQLQEIDSRWQTANQTAAQRQTELETCADRLGSFASAANQLGPWLREKELMMSVLGPLSIDPNMLNTQKQQVQFMLREFETRRPQFDQLTQSAEGILSQTGDSAQDPKDLAEVRSELGSISQQWEDLTSKLTQRSNHIDQAQGTSERYQALLRELSSSLSALSERLDAQASLSAQPEALKRRLQETGEIRSELERRRTEVAEAEKLCQELSAIVAEPYLKEELSKRLESVSGPLKSLEERAADGLSQLQAALSSTQQFQQMFEELRSWLDKQTDPRESSTVALPCQPEAIRSLLAETDELQRGLASQRGSYELIQAEGASLLATLPADERSALQARLTSLRQDWEGLNHRISDREAKLKNTLNKAETYQQHKAELIPWLADCEGKEKELQPSLDSSALDEALQKARNLSLDIERRQPLLEAFNAASDQLLEQCCIGEEEVRDEKAQLNRRVDGLGESLHNRTAQLEELASRLKEFEEGRQAVERRLEAAKHQIEVQEALGPQACSAKSLERLRSQQESLRSLQPQVVYLRDLAQGLVQDAPQTPGGSTEGTRRLQEQAKDAEKEYEDVTDKIEQCCSSLESRLQGVGEVQAHVRDVFSRLADLDDELDSFSPVGRDADSLASQADALKGFLSRLANLRTELEGHASECTTMLRREGSSPDLLALRRETEALSRQAGKLSERGQARLDQIEDAADRVRDFYRLVAELQGLLGRAEENLNAQGLVGTEVEMIKQQLQEFKAVEREQVDSIQPKLQHVNAVGQGLIQSAAKHTDTQALEHDLETTNLQWNSLNKRVAERIAQLQEALLHCGKFQDALEPLLSWLSDTEELVANQKPPSAEYRVVKAQIQEQKLLQRLLDDRRPTVEMIQAEGERIAATADTQDREKIQTQLQSLAERWSDLLDKASGRQRQLEELQVLALQFHEALEPLGEWLSTTERRLSSAEPMGTQTAKITQQIIKHKALQDDVSSREAEVDHLESLSQSLSPLSCAADRDWLSERVGSVRSGHSELADWCSRRAGLLEQALANAQLFGEDEVEVLNWLAEVAQRLTQVSVQSYQLQVLAEQHKHTLALNEEILSRKKTVDQAIKNGQALLKQTTGEEVLLIQEKLDGIKSRYAEMTAGSSKALRTLEQALQLSTRFASAHDDLNQWLDGVETELNTVEPDASPAYQDRQKELKKVSAEKRLVLDTVNEVGSALLDLVPWRAREGLDRLVADANQRYRQADETITQRVQLVQAAIQRSQQYEEAVDAELAWVGETERKLASLGPLSLEPDVTVAQLQVQRAFNIDIIRHKDTVDQLLSTRDDILEACSDAQKDALMLKTGSLSARYDAVSQSHSERFSALEQAQVLVARFWETYEELEPWLGETETLIAQLPPPAIDTDALRLQQDQMRLLRESIAEHKPHIDKLLKIGPQLAELSLQEGATVTQRYADAEKRYQAIKEEVKGRATALDEAVSQSAQLVEFHDKMDPLLETLEGAVQRLRQPPPVAAEVEKIREQLAEHRAQGLELDKLLPSFSALCARGEELIGRAAHDDPAAQAVRSRLLRLRSLWDEIRQRAEEREGKLNDVLDLAGKFWADVAALLSTLRDSQDIVKDLEDPGVDPSLIKQQIEAAEAIKAETDGLREELEFVRTLGADLIFACGETEKPEVKKTIDEMNAAWEGLNRTWRERMERLEEAMTASVQYQDALQSMFDYLDNAVIKLCEMSTVGTDLGTVKQQIEELKQYKVEVYQQQIDMEKLSHQGELLLKKVSDQTDRDMIQEPLTELRHLWENLGDKITQRQHKLEAALLALGQFQHALSELQAWLTHTHTTLDTQRPISSDPKAIEIELAKHHVLRNDVLSHHATVDTVNNAAAELLESSPGDEAGNLRDQLDQLNQSWESLLLKTQERQKLLEAALQQAEGFHGELEEFLQWLRRTESQLSAAKPTGGLPETAREQLQQHMELQAQVTQRAEQYNRLLDQGESMLLARGGEEAGPGTTQTQQNLAMLQNKWGSLNTKMDDRRAKLDEAVSLATGFQTSLQDTINWLTQAEQTLNMAQPPSLILDTVLFQIDEHKVFVNEVNTHREQVLALEKAGSQLRFASLKQDVVLIKNLLLSVQARWDKLVQRSLDRGRHLDEARKRAKQFHEAWRKLTDWLEEAEKRLDSELEISNEPDKIKVQLTKHKEFQKALGSKQPVYDTTVRSGKAMRDKAQLPADTQKLDNLLGEVRDKWDTVCGKSVERQHKLEEALLFSGQFAEALQALVDWLYRVEPQLAEDQPVHGDLDLVSNLMDSHKAFQKELGKRTSSVQALKRSARDLMETGRDDTAWVKVQLQELSNRWDTVCALSVTKQTRLQQALKQAEEFRTAVQLLLEWLSEAEQTLRFRGVLPEEAETLQALLHTHRDFMGTVEEKRTDVNKAAGMGEGILTVCHPDSITTIKHWITIIRARFEEVLTWAKQHEQRLETALTEVLNNANLLEELLSWLQWAETTLVQRDTEPLPQDIPQLKNLITEHQMFMEEMTRKQPDVDKVTKTYKRKPAEPPSSLAERRGARKHQQQQQQQQAAMQVSGGNPRLNQLCARWQQVWLLALDRQRKLNDALDRLEELKEFANFDFDVWRKKYMRWMNHKKSRVMDFFRRIDKDQDGKITRQEFIDGILASKFPTSKLEMTAVADIFDRDGDGYIDYYEFVAALHPNKDAYRPTTDADKIEDEVTRQVAQCKCAKRFQVEQIGENKYRFFLGNQFGDSQQLRLVRILRSTVMVRVGGGWMALDEFLVKNDPCRVQHPGIKILRSDSSSSISSRIARGRTNLELREKFILPEGASQGLAAFRSRGRRSKPGSRNASPTRSSSSASHSGASLPSAPSAPATPTASASSRSSHTHSRDYAKPWLAHSKTPTPTKCHCCPDLGHSHTTPGHEGAPSGSKLKRPTFHSSRGSLTGENGGTTHTSKPSRTDPKRGGSTASGPTSRAGSRAGSRASSRRGSDASDASELQDARSVCSDTSDTPRRPGSGAKPSKIPTISKKTPSPKTPGSAKK